MSQSFIQNLNQTLQSLEQQAMTQRQLQALLFWFQPDANASLIETLLGEEPNERELPNPLAPIVKETLGMDAAACYQSLVHLTPCDMAKFTIIQEFGPKFKQKPFFQKLVQLVASKI